MRTNRNRRIGLYVIALTVLIICAVVIYSKYKLERTYSELQQQKVMLEMRIAEEEERSKEIEEYSVYVKTKRFIIDVARDVLGLNDPDDVIIKEGEASEESGVR